MYRLGPEAVVEAPMELGRQVGESKEAVARLSRNSANSSKPPSSDGPGVKREKKRKGGSGKRKPGGQKGHKGHGRALLPAEEMDRVHEIFPDVCEGCGKALDAGECEEVGEPVGHRVFEPPRVEPIETEYRRRRLRRSCGRSNPGALPGEASRSSFGPGVHAAAGYLSSVHRVARRGVTEIPNDFFGSGVSTGCVAGMPDRVSEARAPVCEEIRGTLPGSPTPSIDETGWNRKGAGRWLRVFIAPLAVFFHAAPGRGSKVLRGVIGESFSGILTSDDYSAYASCHKDGTGRLCRARSIRKLEALEEKEGSRDARAFSKHPLEGIGTIFACRHGFLEMEDARFADRPVRSSPSSFPASRKKTGCATSPNSPLRHRLGNLPCPF